jgi:hypothetical protein
MQRGSENLEDELTFTNHDGYVFHDSPGFEGGYDIPLRIVQEFVRRRSQERRLNDRLHAIWLSPFSICNGKLRSFPFQVLHSDGQCSAIARFKVF